MSIRSCIWDYLTRLQELHYNVKLITTFFSDEEEQDGRRDFNNTVFSVDFPFSVTNVDVLKDESFVFDDLINEAAEEGFVLVLEIESDPSGEVTLRAGRDVLIIRIGDNDGM